jgi:hypothetical protein
VLDGDLITVPAKTIASLHYLCGAQRNSPRGTGGGYEAVDYRQQFQQMRWVCALRGGEFARLAGSRVKGARRIRLLKYPRNCQL